MGWAEGFESGSRGARNVIDMYYKAKDRQQAEALRGDLSAVNKDFTPTQTAVASGVDALAGAQQAKQIALANAANDNERAQIEQDYAPTMQALEADKSRTASVVNTMGAGAGFQQRDKPFSANEVTDAKIAQRAGIYRDAGKDEEADRVEATGLQRKAADLQIGESQDKADQRNKLKEVDTALRAYGEKNIQKDAQGQPVLNDGTMVNMTKMRTLLLSQAGLYDQAMQTAKDGMQYATAKIQADTAERQAATRDAVAAAGMGDFTKALGVYKQFVPDGADPVDIKPGKDGTLVLTRKSALDGAPLPAITFKNMDHLLSSINALADGNALGAYVERTFKHDIESRRLGMEGQRVNIAQQGETRAQGKDTRDEARINAVSTGLAAYADAEAKGDTAAMHSARRTILANGGKLDNLEQQKPDVKVGQIGDITVSQPTAGGGVQVSNYGPDMKQKGSVSVPAPGQSNAATAVATPKTKADFDKLPAGTVYIDPEDGKKYRKHAPPPR